MEQTGLIFEPPKATDFLAGALDYEVLLEEGDWTMYEPTGERQNNPFVFDTKACVTFSLLNVFEARIKLLLQKNLVPRSAIDFLKDNGYLDNGEVNFSDKFLAIMSGTTENGNSFGKVAETVRTVGLIPQSMLPFGDATTWKQWHNPNQITQKMKDLGKQFLYHFGIGYEWVFMDDDPKFDKDAYEACQKQLKQTPLQIAIPLPSSHAVMLSSVTPKKEYRIFNTYEPYGQVKAWSKPIHYAMKILIKPTMNKYKYFTEKEIVGLKPELVEMLDRARGFAGVPFAIVSGFRDKDHNEQVGGVADSAHMKGLAVDLRCRSSRERFKITSGLLMAGFSRIGWGDTFIHADCDGTKDQEVGWLY